MYEYIIGKITAIQPSYFVLEVHGIGYQIAASNPYHYSGKIGQEIKVYVHQVIREDAHLLYGFIDLSEKQLFLRLISVSGIGPKSGLAILANEDHEGLVNAIESGDITYLTKFPGVGKKTAQQLVLDLQGKLEGYATEPQNGNVPNTNDSVAPALEEATEALRALGYSEREVKKATKGLEKEAFQSTDEYLRMALKQMMKK